MISPGPRLSAAKLPTLEEVGGWENECARLDEEIRALQAQRDAYTAMIKGAQALFPFMQTRTVPPIESVVATTTISPIGEPVVLRRGRPPKGTPRAPMTWTGVMEQILARGGKFSFDGLKAEVGKTHLAKKLAKTEKSFYGAIGKLAAAGTLVKHKGWLFHKKSFVEFQQSVAAGLEKDDEAPRVNAAHHSPFGEAIKAFMVKRPQGAESKEIVDELRHTPEFADTIDRHKSHLYNVLARLVDQGELMKGGGRYYRPPSNEREAAP